MRVLSYYYKIVAFLFGKLYYLLVSLHYRSNKAEKIKPLKKQ